MAKRLNHEEMDFDFKSELTTIIPHLRAFARGLCGRADYADDLVQQALLKAWSARNSFEPGTNMRSWTFVILRNAFLTDMRRNRFRGNYDPDYAERTLSHPADQEDGLNMGDLKAAMMELSPERREAVMLVGAGGFSYEEAAGIAHCAVGTMKSRVARGRRSLEALMRDDQSTMRKYAPAAVSHVDMLEALDVLVRH